VITGRLGFGNRANHLVYHTLPSPWRDLNDLLRTRNYETDRVRRVTRYGSQAYRNLRGE
jgi:hypothetical protein